MNILYLIHQFYPNHHSGTERVIFETASYMQKLGCQVTILTYSYEDDVTYPHQMNELLYKEFMFEGLKVIAVKSNDLEYNAGYLIGSESAVYEFLIKKINPDIIHVGHLINMNGFLQAGIRQDIPYLLSLTDFWLICHQAQMLHKNGECCAGPEGGKQCKLTCSGLEKEYYEKRFEQASEILQNSSANIVSSKFLRNMMEHSIENFKSIYIPYGLNFAYLSIKNKLYDKNSKLNILFSGTLSEHKGIKIAIKAFKRLKNKNIYLNIYGDGPLKEYVISVSKSESNINYLGTYSKKDTKILIEENDLILVPSIWYENNPIILQEMIAANLPPIVSNIGSLTEMVDDLKTGFVFTAGSSSDLRKVIEQIASNMGQLNEIKKNMYKNYKIITIEQQCLAYRELYTQILNRDINY